MMALRDIQDELMWCAIASPGSIPQKLRAMRKQVKRYILPEQKNGPSREPFVSIKLVIQFVPNTLSDRC